MQIRKSKYNGASYERLSKEDMLGGGNIKNESNSISNQREIIRNFVKSNEDIEIVKEYVDDGFSGVNFERPGFRRMMEDIRAGLIDCVIVKDLSRFGRNYIETGKYLEKIFPSLGVRFIAISENYDTARTSRGNDQLVIPFMNLVNDAYCRDISIKIRTSLELKQRKGEYVGSFAPYGYRKSQDDIHHLEIDEKAAATVKRIFDLTVAGMSNRKLAELLNREGVSSPAYHKQQEGENYISPFQKGSRAEWSQLTVRRILTNRAYIGVLEQGKTYSINYKLKERLNRDRQYWYCVEGAHEPIIEKATFDLVQRLLQANCRTSPKNENVRAGTVYLFSGIVRCGKCGETLLRRKKKVKGADYIYYGCYDKNKKLRCEHVCIRENQLESTVLEIINKHIRAVVQMSELLDEVQRLPLEKREVKRLDELITESENAMERYSKLKVRVYEDYRDGFIGLQEYKDFIATYERKEKEEKGKRDQLAGKRTQYLEGKGEGQEWMRYFKECGQISTLNRAVLVTLVEGIYVFSANEIEIKFNYGDEFEPVKETAGEYLKSLGKGEN